MKSLSPVRFLTVVLVVIGCVALTAIPGSTTTFASYNLTTGLLTFDYDGPGGTIQPTTFDLADTASPHPCAPTTPPPPSTFEITRNEDDWVFGTELTDTSFNFLYFNVWAGTRNYRLKITHITGSGELGSEVGNTRPVSGQVVLHMDFTASSTTSSTDCGFTSTTIRCLTMTAFFDVEGEWHEQAMDVPGTATVTADTFTIDLVNAQMIFTGPCSAPFATFEEFGTMAIEDLTLCNPAANTDDCLID